MFNIKCILSSQVLAMSAAGHDVLFTFHSTEPSLSSARALRVDLSTGRGLADALAAVRSLDVVINCAAVSQPGLCEKCERAHHPDETPPCAVGKLLTAFAVRSAPGS